MERVQVKPILRVKLVYQSSKSTVCTFTMTRMFGRVNVRKKYGRNFFPALHFTPSKNLLNDGQFRVLKKCHRKFASFTKCYSSKDFGLRVTPSVLISLFNFFVTHFYTLLFCLSELLFFLYLYNIHTVFFSFIMTSENVETSYSFNFQF